MNPDAPDVVLVGRAPNVARAGAIFSRQQTPVPTFVKKVTNQWEYRGLYRVAEVVEGREATRLARKCEPPRGDVAFAMRLEKIEGAIIPDLLTLDYIARKGQGRGLTGPQRKLVEDEAMRRARQWLTDEGFKFKDVSAVECCDFRAQRHREEWVVEVKGTTGGPECVLLTANEVALHRSSYPRNALLVVHGIVLSEDGTNILHGGDLVAVAPWAVEEDRLKGSLL